MNLVSYPQIQVMPHHMLPSAAPPAELTQSEWTLASITVLCYMCLCLVKRPYIAGLLHCMLCIM